MFRLTQKRVRSLSRDRDFLVQSTIAIIAGSIVVALILWFAFGKRQNWYENWIQQARESPEAMLDAIRNSRAIVLRRNGEDTPEELENWPLPFGDESIAPVMPSAGTSDLLQTVDAWLRGCAFEPGTLETFRNYAAARFAPQEVVRRTARVSLEEAATASLPPSFVRECLGDLEFHERQWEAAAQHYEGELKLRESHHARSRLVEIAYLETDLPRLSQLLGNSNFRAATSIHIRFDAYAKLRDFNGIFATVLVHDYSRLSAAYVGLTLFVALVWFFIVGQFSGFRAGQLLVYLAAILLGVLSATLTLFVVIVQEQVFGLFPQTGNLAQGLVNNVAGIGLREETVKMICFLPLIPLLLRRNNPIEALVVAGFVGLGFAIQENLSFYSRTGGDATVSRFLTANFFHLSLTGLAGFAAYRFAKAPRRNWEEFVATFLIVVLAHGLYDALLTLPDLKEFSMVSVIVFALLAYRFFGLAHSLPLTWRQELSPLGIFVIGTSLLVGVTLNVVCFGQHPYPNYLLFLFACVQLIPAAFIFVNTFRSS